MSERIIYRDDLPREDSFIFERELKDDEAIALGNISLYEAGLGSKFGLPEAIEPFFVLHAGPYDYPCSIGQVFESDSGIGFESIGKNRLDERIVALRSGANRGIWIAVLEPIEAGERAKDQRRGPNQYAKGIKIQEIRAFCWNAYRYPDYPRPHLFTHSPVGNHLKELQVGFVMRDRGYLYPICNAEEHPTLGLRGFHIPEAPVYRFSIEKGQARFDPVG